MRKSRKQQLKKLRVHMFTEHQLADIFSYQARYIADGLRAFYKMNRTSISPNSIFEHFCKKHHITTTYESIKEHPEAYAAAEKEARAYWDSIILKMIYAFEQIALNYPDSPQELWFDQAYKKIIEAGKKPTIIERTKRLPDGTYVTDSSFDLIETPEAIWDEERAYHKKICHGTRLYGKYVQDLWD